MTRVCRIVRIITYKIFLVEKKNQQKSVSKKSSRGQKYSYIHAHALTTYYKIRYPKRKKKFIFGTMVPLLIQVLVFAILKRQTH